MKEYLLMAAGIVLLFLPSLAVRFIIYRRRLLRNEASLGALITGLVTTVLAYFAQPPESRGFLVLGIVLIVFYFANYAILRIPDKATKKVNKW